MTRYINNTTVRAERQDKDGKEGYNVCNFKKDSEGNLCYFWIDKDDFESDYRSVEAMTFGLAIEAMKEGCMVTRKGWNGKDMYLQMVDPYDTSLFSITENEIVGTLMPWIGMKTAQNTFIPWIASQSDILAEDWGLYPVN